MIRLTLALATGAYLGATWAMRSIDAITAVGR
jgi:hypothetical protein